MIITTFILNCIVIGWLAYMSKANDALNAIFKTIFVVTFVLNVISFITYIVEAIK